MLNKLTDRGLRCVAEALKQFVEDHTLILRAIQL
jgi:tRNA nucleotidyltransferase/poly(A) polymerase